MLPGPPARSPAKMVDLRGFAFRSMALPLIALFLFAVLLLSDLLRLDGLRVGQHALLGRDFVNVWVGGKLALSHQTNLIYDIHGYRHYIDAVFGIRDVYAYSYPPSTLLLASVLAQFPYLVALAIWTGAGTIAFYLAAKPYLLEARLSPALAFCMPAGFVSIWAGHYGLLIGALGLLGYRNLDHHPRIAGFMFGLMTMKPHLGILVALVLLLQARTQVIGYACLTFGLLFALSGLAFGFETWSVYVFQTLGFHAKLLTDNVAAFHSMMPTTTAALLRMGAPTPIVTMAQAVSAVYAVAMVVIAVRRKIMTVDVGLIASTAIFLLLPYAFNYDMTIMSLGILIFAARNYEYSNFEKAALSIGFILPLLMGPGRQFIGAGPVVVAVVLFVQLKIATATLPTARRGDLAGGGGGRSA